jgi:ribosomal protein L34E
MVPQDDLDYSLALLSEHRKMAHAGDRCHRCGKKIEGMKCVKPGCWYVWCEECW